MKRAVASAIARDDVSSVIELTAVDRPTAREGWTVVAVRAAALNQHDLWSIRGVGTTEADLPIGLCSDIAGETLDGRAVVAHALVADPDAPGGELLDPRRRMLADVSGGGAAEFVAVPTRNLVPKPENLSFEQAAALPTAWLTAYRMLFSAGGTRPGDTVLVQGAGGGVATAAIALGAAAGLRVWVCGRDEERRRRAAELGAAATFEAGARLPERVDAVIDTVGAATWEHSVKSCRPGGTVVVAGGTTGGKVTAELTRIFLPHVRIQGTSLGTLDEFRRLVAFCANNAIAPPIDSVFALDDAAAAVRHLAGGEAFGKVLIAPNPA